MCQTVCVHESIVVVMATGGSSVDADVARDASLAADLAPPPFCLLAV